MTTDFDLKDVVVVDKAFLAGKELERVEGRIESIAITEERGTEYYIRFFFPKGTILDGEDVSGQETVGVYAIPQDRVLYGALF